MGNFFLKHAHQQPPVRRVRVPAPEAVPGRRGWNALGSHPRDPVVVQPKLPACARLRDGLGVRRLFQNPGCTRNRAVLKAVKTDCVDCVVFQNLPKKFQGLVDSLVRERHSDGTPVYRCKEVKDLEGQYRIPRIEAEWMCNIDTRSRRTLCSTALRAQEEPFFCFLFVTWYDGVSKSRARTAKSAVRKKFVLYAVRVKCCLNTPARLHGVQRALPQGRRP